MKRSILIVAAAFLSAELLISCSKSVRQDSQGSELESEAKSVIAVMSSADQSHLMETQSGIVLGEDALGSSETPAAQITLIKINPDKKYQEILGFGAAITDGTASLLTKALSKEALADLWVKLFDPEQGIGLSYMRMAMGASDLSPELYSYEDQAGHFSIDHDKSAASPVIPLLKQAMKLNPSLRVMGTPWSAPAWMKDNHSMIGGWLAPEHQKDFAEYIAKTVKAWQAEGLNVESITMQNEPKNGKIFTTSVFDLYPSDGIGGQAPVDEQTFLAQYLGPEFERQGLKAKILVWDHNYSYGAVDMVPEVLKLLSHPLARHYSGGAAFHCYMDPVPGKTVAEISTIPEAYPEQDLYMSECSSGTWRSWSEQFNYDASQWIIAPLRSGAKVVLKWGLALDENHGPYLKGYVDSCGVCIGVVTLQNSVDGKYTGKWSYARDYYILGQISRFVRPGAHRVDSNESEDHVVQDVAFVNPDGSQVLYTYNSGKLPRHLRVKSGDKYFEFILPGQSVVTFKW